MRQLLLTLSVLLAYSTLFGQNIIENPRHSKYQYIFQLTNDDAEQLYSSQYKDDFLHSLVDSFPYGTVQPPLNPGHYLIVSAKDNDLDISYTFRNDISLNILDNKQDLLIQLRGANGEIINNADVQLSGKTLDYEPLRECYIWKDCSKSGTLLVKHGANFGIYTIKKSKNNNYDYLSHWKYSYHIPYRFIYSPFRQFIYYPAKRTILFPYRLTKNVIKGNWWHFRGWYMRPYQRAKRLIGKFTHKRPTKLASTIYLDKPKYRPGDTVRVKALFWKNAKPYGKKAVQIYLGQYIHSYSYMSSKKKIAFLDKEYKRVGRDIEPFRKGSYTHEFVLHDSLNLKLDRSYQVGIYIDGNVATTAQIYYEDYELRSAKFEATGFQEQYKEQETVQFSITGKDANDLPLMGAKLSLKLTSSAMQEYDTTQVYVPFTIWEMDTVLLPTGEIGFSLPDSLFANANMKYQFSAECRTTDNELHRLYETFSFDKTTYHAEFALEAGQVKYTMYENGNLYYGDGIISRHLASGLIQTDTVSLPYTETVRQDVTYYRFLKAPKGGMQKYQIDASAAKISANHYTTGDSLYIVIDNPNNLQYTFQLFLGDKETAKGSNSGSNVIAFPKSYRKHNYFQMQYVWAGKALWENINIAPFRKRLYIDVDSLSGIYPGVNATMRLKVTDYKGRPVKNADVLAYGVNSEFGRSIKSPEMPYFENTSWQKKYGDSFTQNQQGTGQFMDLLNYERFSKWKMPMGLDTNAYYQFLYPGTKLFVTSVPTEDSVTQFAPFVVSNGAIQPVMIVYKDYDPIYFGNTTTAQAYSFASDTIIGRLTIRTPKGQYTIYGLRLQKGMKTIISMDADSCKRCSFVERQSQFSTDEVEMMRHRLISFNNNGLPQWSAIKQGSDFTPITYSSASYNNTVIGPFRQGGAKILNMQGDTVNINLKTNFKYAVYGNQIELTRDGNVFNYWDGIYKRDLVPLQFVETEASYKRKYEEWKSHGYYRVPSKKYVYSESNLRFDSKNELRIDLSVPKSTEIDRLILENSRGQQYLFNSHARYFEHLSPGMHKLYVVLKDSSYFQYDNINVRDGYKLFVRAHFSESDLQIEKRRPYDLSTFEVHKYTQLQPEPVWIAPVITPVLAKQTGQYFHGGRKVTGVVTDISDMGGGLPAIGANVVVKGTTNGTATDFDGQYTIWVDDEDAILVFSSIGLKTQEFIVGNTGTINVALDVDSKAIMEVVKMGYLVAKKEDATAAITSVGGDDISEKPTLGVDRALRGKAAGVRVTSNSGAPGSGVQVQIRGMTSITGSRPVPTEPEHKTNTLSMEEHYETLKNISQSISTRTYFSDCAFWEPELISDKNGFVNISTTMPGNITAWKTFFVARAGKDLTGTGQTMLNSYKPLVAEINVPRFLNIGDSCSVLAETRNYMETPVLLTNVAQINGDTVLMEKRTVEVLQIDTLAVEPQIADSITVNYALTTDDGYSDALERTIPVFPVGTAETQGQFATFDSDTTVTFAFDSTGGPIHIYAESDGLGIVIRELENTWNYKHLCNEQLASKLKSLLAHQQIKKVMGDSVDISERVDFIIKKLLKTQNSDGLWGWWTGSPTQMRFSAHIVEALLWARAEGYKVDYDEQPTIALVISRLSTQNSYTLLDNLLFLQSVKAGVDMTPFIEHLDTLKMYNFYEYLQLMHLKQQRGMEVCIDTLLLTMHEDLLRGSYWGYRGYHIYNNTMMISALAYKILKMDGQRTDLLPQIRRYFFSNRTNGYWRNTYESITVTEAILKDILKNYNPKQVNALLIPEIQGDSITKFPFADTIPAQQSLTVMKTGNAPMYFTAYQRIWNETPEAYANNFHVTTSFSKTQFVAGEPLTLTASVHVDKDAEYTMIEIPIPASCSYLNKGKQWGEIHREYFKEKVCIFMQKMPAGDYSYKVQLLPRYSGSFTLNPAKAELMYFPTFYGRTGLKTISVK